MNTRQKGWIMKRLAWLTVLVALFFGTFAAASAHAPYYVSWDATARYTCTHTNGQYQMNVVHTYLDYYAASDVIMNETDIDDDPTGHHITPQASQTDWAGYLGQRKHWNITIVSTGYPITLEADLRTYDNGKEVHLSTLTARCSADSNGSLLASTNNIENPLVFGVWSEGGVSSYHP